MGDNRTVYILDQGFIRFGKFVAGVLAVFITVGIFLYGIDVKESLKNVDVSTKAAEDSARVVQQSAFNISKIESDVHKAQDDVKSDQVTATNALAQTQTSVGALQQQVTDIQTKQAETSSAAAKAVAAETRIQNARQEIETDEEHAKTSVQQVEDLASKILATSHQVDIAYAHINFYVGNGAPQDAKPETLVPVSVAQSETEAPSPDRPFTPLQLAAVYHFPAKLNGAGQTIGLIELAGGYRNNEMAAYFKKLGLPAPTLTAVPVDGAKNAPSGSDGPDGQVQLDIEAAGAVAPGAHIVVYFCPNTDKGFIDGISTAIHDEINRPSVLNISWGSNEPAWTGQSMQAMNEALRAGVIRGVTVLVAAGDNGPTDGLPAGKLAVDFPASSPWVTAVGGTHLHATNGGILSEVAWDDSSIGSGSTGWGVSSFFERPLWQKGTATTASQNGFVGRAIPDVAADASPSTGYEVEIDGDAKEIGGTSASAPLWAGLIAVINQGLGRNIGFLNPILYEKLGPAQSLRQTDPSGIHPTVGGSPAERAKWNPITGWGTPDGQKLLNALLQKE